jgi:hypothetical protein
MITRSNALLTQTQIWMSSRERIHGELGLLAIKTRCIRGNCTCAARKRKIEYKNREPGNKQSLLVCVVVFRLA